MADGTTDDESRWAEALSLVERRSSAPAERRPRRGRALALALALGCVAVLAAWFLGDGVGGVLQLLGGLPMIASGVTLVRGAERVWPWRRPLDVLTIRQRRELVHQLRGRAPLVPGRVALVRALAETLVDRHQQRGLLMLALGSTLTFVGGTVREPEAWRPLVSGLVAAFLLVALVVSHRDVARARRFLEQHPLQERAP